MKVSKIQKFQFSNFLVSWDKFESTAQANIQKSQYFIYFMNLKKRGSPTRVTFTNHNCELGKV